MLPLTIIVSKKGYLIMSKFYNALMLTTLLIPCVALGNENSEAQNASSLTANLKRIALQYNQNSVSNREDPNYPGTFTSDEQEVFTGIFDGNI